MLISLMLAEGGDKSLGGESEGKYWSAIKRKKKNMEEKQKKKGM